MGYEKQLHAAEEIAFKTGKYIYQSLGKADISLKSTNNLVTDVDKNAEEMIFSFITDIFPDNKLLGEESASETDINSDCLWIVDPLDGTNNFAHQIPQFSVSIAYAEKGDVKAGVVYDPCKNELFKAEKGGKAFLNDSLITPGDKNSLTEIIVGTGFYYDRGELMKKTLRAIEKLFENNIQGLRRMGSAALDICWLAAGRFGAYFEYQLNPWDYAAAMLIAREAGIKICDINGRDISLESNGMISSLPGLFDEFLNLTKMDESVL